MTPADDILRKVRECGYWVEHPRDDGTADVCIDGWITLTPDEVAYLNMTRFAEGAGIPTTELTVQGWFLPFGDRPGR